MTPWQEFTGQLRLAGLGLAVALAYAGGLGLWGGS